MTEPRLTMIRRMKMRSMRRGIKEMDLILQDFAETHLDAMSDADLALYDALLQENDHDLYKWVSDPAAAPADLRPLMTQISARAEGLVKDG